MQISWYFFIIEWRIITSISILGKRYVKTVDIYIRKAVSAEEKTKVSFAVMAEYEWAFADNRAMLPDFQSTKD